MNNQYFYDIIIKSIKMGIRAYYAAGDLLSGVSRWLRSKIIGPGMNNDRFPNNFVNCEAICQDRHIGAPVTGKQRRQVTGMIIM